MNTINIEGSWRKILHSEFEKPYFKTIVSSLNKARKEGKTIYPPQHLIFNAFNLTPFPKVNVVILGQDPYHRPKQAIGLSFAVAKDCKIPPSLKNIYKELKYDLGVNSTPAHGDLTHWSRQGVLLINSILTVEEKKPGSHKCLGWQVFTDAIISHISSRRKGIIFILWGKFAQRKKTLIDKQKHYILESAHPSPLARGAFFGNRHFSTCNRLLEQDGKSIINWIL